MKKKTGIMILVLLLAVGFAAVSATLIISGNTAFTTNDDEFEVIFTKAIIDDVEDNSVISADGKSISYTTKELSFIDDYSKLDFTVKNNSTQYDAEVSIECIGGSNAGTYYEITKNFASSIPAQTEAEGNVTVTMIRSSVNDIEETFTCTITGNAVERDTAAEIVPDEPKTQITYEDTDNSGTRNIGDIVTISKEGASTEEFYVIGIENDDIKLLSKFNIKTDTLLQADVAYSETATAFSSTNYWSADFTSSPYDLVETGEPSSDHYAAYYAYKYGEKLGVTTGRLMYHSEANTLGTTIPDIIYGRDSTANTNSSGLGYLYYWLGSADDASIVRFVNGNHSALTYNTFSNSSEGGVRPVITISADLL